MPGSGGRLPVYFEVYYYSLACATDGGGGHGLACAVLCSILFHLSYTCTFYPAADERRLRREVPRQGTCHRDWSHCSVCAHRGAHRGACAGLLLKAGRRLFSGARSPHCPGMRCIRSELRAHCIGQRALAPPNTNAALYHAVAYCVTRILRILPYPYTALLVCSNPSEHCSPPPLCLIQLGCQRELGAAEPAQVIRYTEGQ